MGIEKNKAWMWNIVYVILIFHGVALQKLQTKAIEEYLEVIDDLVDGIHYKNGCTNAKYAHIPLRIKYLFMDVQEYIETTNGSKIAHTPNSGFLQPKKLIEIHAEFCKENNISPEELRKQLQVKMQNQSEASSQKVAKSKNSKTKSPKKNSSASPSTHHNNEYSHRYGPQQNEYPWHTPPRFQRMRQQQRLEKEKQKQNKNKTKQKKEKVQPSTPKTKPTQSPKPKPKPKPKKVKKSRQQRNKSTATKSGPLYLYNLNIPAPPKRAPPLPPINSIIAQIVKPKSNKKAAST